MRYIFTLRYLLILSVILCASCGTALPTVKPYKLDVQQGNVVTSKMLLQLRPGMTKSQVRFIMGTPLIQDSFHGNRWDYVYQLREGGKVTEQRRVILDFENELLKAVRGDVIPAGSDKDKSADEAVNKGTRVVKPNAKPQDKGLVDKLQFWKKDEAAPADSDAQKKADEAAKKAAVPAPENLVTPAEQGPPAEETKSILTVPMDVVPAQEMPVENAPTPALTAPAETPPAEVKSIDATPAEVAPAAVPKTESAPVMAPPAQEPVSEVPVQEPAKVPSYDSPAGMQFDRNMRFMPEPAVPEAKPAVVEPRAGNKTPPKPRDLPAEGDPGFFERMLEKIGF